MHRYVIKFTKHGSIKYISHLDLLRLFKRTFKRLDIKLSYSQGFNPHPKMGFAQPLSLGYESNGELLEFETATTLSEKDLAENMNRVMPEGLTIVSAKELPMEGKSLAAITEYAEYTLRIPLLEEITSIKSPEEWLQQNEIMVEKTNKKKELVQVNIRGMIHDLTMNLSEHMLLIHVKLNAGSESNLSPELFLKALTNFYGISFDRSEVEITRENIQFTNKLQF